MVKAVTKTAIKVQKPAMKTSLTGKGKGYGSIGNNAMMQMVIQMMGGGGFGGGFGGKGYKGGTGGGSKRESDPAGSGRVFVRGFDFDTTEAQLKQHVGSVGAILNVFFVSKGSAEVVYKTKKHAEAAVTQLNGTTIDGNSRFIDVILKDFAGSGRVFARGFDFGTTDEQLASHMSSVGKVVKVLWVTKGSAEVTYATTGQAEAAVAQLNGTTIDGNSRFIDVLLKDNDEMMDGGGFGDGFRAKGYKGGTDGGNKRESDPTGFGRVFVRGFDFDTTDEQLVSHMGVVGTIASVYWVTKGSAVVIYSTRKEAEAAVNLNGSTIEGNSRFIDVFLKDSE